MKQYYILTPLETLEPKILEYGDEPTEVDYQVSDDGELSITRITEENGKLTFEQFSNLDGSQKNWVGLQIAELNNEDEENPYHEV